MFVLFAAMALASVGKAGAQCNFRSCNHDAQCSQASSTAENDKLGTNVLITAIFTLLGGVIGLAGGIYSTKKTIEANTVNIQRQIKAETGWKRIEALRETLATIGRSGVNVAHGTDNNKDERRTLQRSTFKLHMLLSSIPTERRNEILKDRSTAETIDEKLVGYSHYLYQQAGTEFKDISEIDNAISIIMKSGADKLRALEDEIAK